MRKEYVDALILVVRVFFLRYTLRRVFVVTSILGLLLRAECLLTACVEHSIIS